jgi:hypothetical protein
MIRHGECQFYFNGECHIDIPFVQSVNPSFTAMKSYWPVVVFDEIGCSRGVLISGIPPEEIDFQDNFESGWFEINSPFDIQFYDNIESGWFILNDFGSSIFAEDFEGVWV